MSALPLSRRKFLALSAALAAGQAGRARYSEPTPVPGHDLAAGNTRFGLNLYGKLRGNKGNVFFSPFSVSVALGMTAAGAKGETRAEFEKVLQLPADPTAANAAFGELISAVNATGPAEKRDYELSTANALWAQKGYPWRKEYVATVNQMYQAAVEDVDYRQPEEARSIINTWVEKQTKDKIKNLIPKGSVTPATRLVLTNAIYFKGDWLSAFPKKQTIEQPFVLADGKSVRVPLMHQSKIFAHGEQPGLQILELPYIDNELSMVVLLPEKRDGLAKLESDLTPDNLSKWRAAVRPQTVEVFLPRFKVETKYTLNEPLKNLGLKAAFGDADFSGMSTSGEKFHISLIVHKAFVDVNEVGTEAAAATGIVMMGGGMPARPKLFRADRPFLFLIRQNKTGSILFMGRVENPKT